MNKSRSFLAYEQIIHRARGMLELAICYETMLDTGKIAETEQIKVSDLGRASIVLGVSSMDTYFTRKFAEVLVPFMKTHDATQDLISILSKAGLDTAGALQLLKMQRPYGRVRTIVESYLDRKAAQRFEVIDGLFLCFGLTRFCDNVQRLSEHKHTLSRIKRLVKRRHAIVHEGDVDSRGRLRPLALKTLELQMVELTRFVWHAESHINSALNMPRWQDE